MSSRREIVAVDLGGTHVRFSIAELEGGRVRTLSEPVIYATSQFANLQTAWASFKNSMSRLVPNEASVAVACPIHDGPLKLSNNSWVITRKELEKQLGLSSLKLLNDFEAVGHAVSQLDESNFVHVGGPNSAPATEGVTTVIGPGTGLGVAAVLRRGGRFIVLPSEAGHMDFAPLDEFEDALLNRLRKKHRRVSVERIVSGPGLLDLYLSLAIIEGRKVPILDDSDLWQMALEGSDSIAAAALERFCLSLGAVAGDLALAQRASSVVIAGSLGTRLAGHLSRSGFWARFIAKGRFENLMSQLPVKLLVHPQAGIYGAAAAFANGIN